MLVSLFPSYVIFPAQKTKTREPNPRKAEAEPARQQKLPVRNYRGDTHTKLAASFVGPDPEYRVCNGNGQIGRVPPVGKFCATRGSNGAPAGNGDAVFVFVAIISSGATPPSTQSVIAASNVPLKLEVAGPPPQCAIFGIMNKSAKSFACPPITRSTVS